MAENRMLWIGTLFVAFCIILSAVGVIKAVGDHKKNIAKELFVTTKLGILEDKQVNMDKDINNKIQRTQEYTDNKISRVKADVNNTKSQLISMIPKEQYLSNPYAPIATCLISNDTKTGVITLSCAKD